AWSAPWLSPSWPPVWRPRAVSVSALRAHGRRLTAFGARLLGLPAAASPLVLVLDPGEQGTEVLHQGRGIHAALAGQGLERLGPRFARAHGEHGLQLLSSFLAAVDRTLVERALVARLAAQRPMELELEDVGQEVARVGRVARHVELGARVEVLFTAWVRRRDALVASAQVPPTLVVVGRRDVAAEDAPALLVDHFAEG